MAELRPISFEAPLGRRIIDLHVWAVRQGLSGAAAEELFAGFCRRLADAGVPLWRSFAAMRTLHPQWVVPQFEIRGSETVRG
jgi:adenylate cyclase